MGVVIFLITYLVTTDDVSRLFTYSAKQYGWLFVTACLQNVALTSKCVAAQVEKSGVISMLGYIALVYACMVDVFIFHDSLNWLEWFGLGVILATTIALTTHLIKTKNKDTAK